jgi:hypothetical protein
LQVLLKISKGDLYQKLLDNYISRILIHSKVINGLLTNHINRFLDIAEIKYEVLVPEIAIEF